jgi:polyisoprenoid-binding protein YceI
MKNNFKTIPFLIAICVIGFTTVLCAQTIYKIADSKNNNMKLSGTSTLHDWTMNAPVFSSEAQFVLTGRQISLLKALTFSLAVADLKSGESGLDKNAYKALKSGDHQNITYKLNSATVSADGNKFLIKTHGSLTIAGVTKEVSIDVSAVVNADETITCTGSEKLNMTDYQVKPPKFMLGAMKTGNAITLDFTLVYKK